MSAGKDGCEHNMRREGLGGNVEVDIDNEKTNLDGGL